MSAAVFAGHTLAELDALLDTRRRVLDHPRYTDRFEQRSERFRRESGCELDIPYGQHPRERLDLFRPARSGAAPVNLFLHGGYWRDMEPIRLSYLNDDLGLSAEAAARNSPSRLRPSGPAPLVAAVGGLEGAEFLRQNATIAKAWGPMSPVTPMVLGGLHHYSAVEALADPDSELGRAVLEQMALS